MNSNDKRAVKSVDPVVLWESLTAVLPISMPYFICFCGQRLSCFPLCQEAPLSKAVSSIVASTPEERCGDTGVCT